MRSSRNNRKRRSRESSRRKTEDERGKPSGPRAARPELVLQTGVTAPAYNAVFSPDGRLLASMDFMAGSIKLWEISTGRELCAINLGARSSIDL